MKNLWVETFCDIEAIDKDVKYISHFFMNIWVKVFKNGPSEICGRQPLKKLK